MEFIDRFIYTITQLHPLHPMIVHFPIALTAASFLFILLAYWRNNSSFENAAFVNIALASIGTLVAGITGMMDNIKNYEGEAPNASTKITLAAILLVLTTTISVIRYRNPKLFKSANRFIYISSYGLSFLIAFTLSFLGGVILYGF